MRSAPERHEDVRKLHLVGGSGRSPGSWVQGAVGAPSAASTFPGLFRRPSGLRRQLPTHGGGTAPVPEVGPYITNNINNANNTNAVNTATPTEDNIKQEDVGNAKKKGGRGTPENLEEVTAFFLSIHSTESEAAHFYHHYNAVGWVKGNNLPVKNWHSTAEAGLRNSPRFKAAQPGGPTPGSLQTPGTPGVTKNYDIKL